MDQQNPNWFLLLHLRFFIIINSSFFRHYSWQIGKWTDDSLRFLFTTTAFTETCTGWISSCGLMLIKLSHRVGTGSSTSPFWTSTRWSCPRSTAAGRPWWRRCWRLRQRTQTRSAGISATSTSSTGWLRIASRTRQKSWMGKSLLMFLIIPSLNTCTWWTTCSGVQTIQKVNIDIDW